MKPAETRDLQSVKCRKVIDGMINDRTNELRLCLGVALCVIGLLLPAAAMAQEENRVGLVITHDDGTVVQQCISFSESEITGLQVLERSGLDLNYDAGTPWAHPSAALTAKAVIFRKMIASANAWSHLARFWSYGSPWRSDWIYSSIGAANRNVSDEDVEAWVWSEGTINSNADRRPPAGLTFDQICGGAKSADVIVQFDDSDAVIRSIEFNDEISGLDALMLSGLEVVTTTTDFGPAVCSIEGVGCPADDCFCQSELLGLQSMGRRCLARLSWLAQSTPLSARPRPLKAGVWGEFGDVMSPATNAQAAQMH